MWNVLNLLICLLLLPVITYCNFGEKDEKESSGDTDYGQVDFIGHCMKYMKIKKPEKIENIEDSKDGNKKSDVEKEITDPETELVMYFAYSITETSDGDRYVECWINDGGREYKNDTIIRGGQKYLTRNYCTITYDLDDASFGEFTFEYSQDWAWINYTDPETGYKFDTKFRTSECVALSR